MTTTGIAQHFPLSEEISARAQQMYLNSWEESFSVEHLIAAEQELHQEYADRQCVETTPTATAKA